MFNRILVPVDLAVKETLKTAVQVACDQARHYGADIVMVSVTGGIQARVSHSTEKYKRLLEEFAQSVATRYGVSIDSTVYDVPDPSVEVDRLLLRAIEETGADLVVMATHQPGWVEYLVNSHGGRLAAHTPISVFVVRTPE